MWFGGGDNEDRQIGSGFYFRRVYMYITNTRLRSLGSMRWTGRLVIAYGFGNSYFGLSRPQNTAVDTVFPDRWRNRSMTHEIRDVRLARCV